MLIAAPLGWQVTDVIESQNDFCMSCHLHPDTPLHETKMIEFTAHPAVNLASVHFVADDAFRCIDCHGGASFRNRLRVKFVAARDVAMYLAGRFVEPDSMEHPLWDEDCTQCHASYEARRSDDFHALDDHNLPDFAFRCVECHTSHPTGSSPAFVFLNRSRVLETCEICHEEL